jgi:phosphatidylglycerophosphate synthase
MVLTGPAIGLIGQLALLAALAQLAGSGAGGISAAGWVVGGAYGVGTNLALACGLIGTGAKRLGPADRVTLIRSILVGGVTALVATSLSHPVPVTPLVALTVVALVLDAVDGWVARRTGTSSKLGWRFDQEVDAFLILVLSVYVAFSTAWWVLVIGLARYVFAAVGWLVPWMRGTLLPPRYWGKVVAAVQGIALTVAMADVLPRPWTLAVLVVSLALLVESFARSVWWLWRRRPAPVPGRVRTGVSVVTATISVLLVWVALVAPSELSDFTPTAFVRIPVEGLVVVPLLLVLPAMVDRVVAALLGVALGVLTLVKILDLGFSAALDRPFNPVADWRYSGTAVETLRESVGSTGAVLGVVGAGVLVAAVLVLIPLSVLRLTRLAERHRRPVLHTVSALTVAWVLCAVLGVQLVSGVPVASASAGGLAHDKAQAWWTDLQDHSHFATDLADDRFRATPDDQLLTGLRGKDVLLVFVESYGKVAVQDSPISAEVGATLDDGTRRLQAAGFSSRSAWLTSPTFGGISWLAHSTLQSGAWVDSQRRYDQLMLSDRLTLSQAFKRAGWRTVGDVPSNNRTWPQGTSFYQYEQLYDRRNVGYRGPTYAYASMPDQYVMSAFHRLELAQQDRRPVFAEIDLVSSHTPWTRVPDMIDWDDVGDGSVFSSLPAHEEPRASLWSDPARVQAAYGRSIEYSLNALVEFVERYGDDDLVLVVLGDHQPAAIVTGHGASHDVPVTVMASDPAVLQRISGWGWQDGMRPDSQAPAWRMDAFRDRFLSAYGGQG